MAATAEKPADTKKAADVPGGVMTLSRYMLDQARINKDYQVRAAPAFLLLASFLFSAGEYTYWRKDESGVTRTTILKILGRSGLSTFSKSKSKYTLEHLCTTPYGLRC